ncbi:hypothetical protein MMC21_008467 [Puttea exsequens]|nr:hypothetical protein [Puttea exsequens]
MHLTSLSLWAVLAASFATPTFAALTRRKFNLDSTTLDKRHAWTDDIVCETTLGSPNTHDITNAINQCQSWDDSSEECYQMNGDDSHCTKSPCKYGTAAISLCGTETTQETLNGDWPPPDPDPQKCDHLIYYADGIQQKCLAQIGDHWYAGGHVQLGNGSFTNNWVVELIHS